MQLNIDDAGVFDCTLNYMGKSVGLQKTVTDVPKTRMVMLVLQNTGMQIWL